MDLRPNLLCTGDPRAMRSGDEPTPRPRRGQPATFSRFVLPLPYRLTRAPAPSHTETKCFFAEANSEDWLHSAARGEFRPEPTNFAAVLEASLDQERRDYFTRETAEVLFHRARWFVLRGLEAPVFRLRVRRDDDEARVTVHLRAPALILFERPRTPEDSGPIGTLPHAMLILEARWEPGRGDAAPRLDDLLVFNELFRYFQRPFERHARLPDKDGNPDHNYLRELADLPADWRDPNTKLGSGGAKDGDKDDKDPRLACYLNRWMWMLDCPVRLPSTRRLAAPDSPEWEWWSLFPQDWRANARQWALSKYAANAGADADGEEKSPAHGWLLYADHRAYVWSCAVLQEAAPLLERVKTLGRDVAGSVGTDLGHWLRLVNMDPPGPSPDTCTAFEARFADERTYRRWAHCGALQGFNYHGGAMLTGPRDEPPTWRHFGAMYFDQALLLLYLRVTLFRFSYDLSRLSAAARRQHDDDEALRHLAERFERLRMDFALFTNLYQFPLLSNQQQGIELYSLCRDRMDVKALFEEVKNEVEATHEFLALRAQDEMTQIGGQLTVVATVGMIASLVLAGLGVSEFAFDPFDLRRVDRLGVARVAGFLLLFSLLLLAGALRFSSPLLRRFKALARRGHKPPGRRPHDKSP